VAGGEQPDRRGGSGSGDERRIWSSSRLPVVLGAVCAGVPVVAAVAQGPLEPVAIAQHAMAAGAGIVALFLVVSLVLRAARAHWSGRSVRSALRSVRAIWCAAFSALAAVGFLHHPRVLIALFGVVMLVWFRQWREAVASRAHSHRTSPTTSPPCTRSITCPIEFPASENEEVLVHLRGRLGKRVRAAYDSRTDSPGQPTVSVATITVGVIVVAILWSWAPSVVHFAQSGFSGGKSTSTSTSTSTQTSTALTPPAPSTPTAPPTTTPPPTQTKAGTPAWAGTCTTGPSNTAPRQYEVEIEEMYAGERQTATTDEPRFPLPERTGRAPGRREGGCTKEFHEEMTAVGPFVWAWGQNPNTGRVLSIAVDSEHYGPALFLAPAAEPVHALIDRFGAVGGIRRLEAGTGDFYPVKTRMGTFILIRREKGSELDEYASMEPVVGQAWAQAMKRAHAFLWPVRIANGTWDFDSDSPASTVVFSFSTASPNAEEPELGERELEEDAARA
jgi:hypothetical protein